MNAAASDASRSPLGSVSSKRTNTDLDTLTVNEAETMVCVAIHFTIYLYQ